MIDRQALLSDLQKLLQRLEADLLERSESAEVPEVGRKLRAEYDRAKTAERTAQNYEDWRTDAITQHAAAWVLSCVFVRFLEDNRLIDPPRIAGPAERLQRARDEHELYFKKHPKQTDRDYLLAVFDQLTTLPGTKDVFGEHNPIGELPTWLSGDAAGELVQFFQKIDANTGALVHDFTDPNWDTRFLGDLYQDLSEAARKQYALLQTPEFVEEFILDRTLNPALDEFGLDAAPVLDQTGKPLTESGFRMIDPACGSGHFLLGAFPRILDRWQRKEPGTNIRELVQRTLDSIHGVDVNPYAVAIARFRLLLAAMRASRVKQLADAPAFQLHLACGDSLLHAPLRTGHQVFDFELTNGDTEFEHAYQTEDLPILKKMLRGGQYHAVFANPPYITVKDKVLNAAYRRRYSTCFGKYHLSVPFLQRLTALSLPNPHSGFVGVIMDDQFMKQQFGKPLVTEFLSKRLLTHVISTAGAYIPGHGTPTVILFLRNRQANDSPIRTVMSIRGEPSTPNDPAHGLVWRSIVEHIDIVGSVTDFVSVSDLPRERLATHPWSIGGGGASDVKQAIDASACGRLGDLCQTVGYAAIVGLDEIYVADSTKAFLRMGIQADSLRPFSGGDRIRHWMAKHLEACIYPHDSIGEYRHLPDAQKHLWVYRTALREGLFFGATKRDRGKDWREFAVVVQDKLFRDDAVLYASVATHAQFAMGPVGVVSSQSAPSVLLPSGQGRSAYARLLGFLNSSTVCFYLKQTCHNKGSTIDQHGARQRTEAFEDFFDHSATRVREIPTPVRVTDLEPRGLAMMELADNLARRAPDTVLQSGAVNISVLRDAASDYERVQSFMMSLQEELDWQCYQLYGLTDEDVTCSEPPPIKLAERAFEIAMARQMAAGDLKTTWFDRHGSTPLTEIPTNWPDEYRRLVERRIELIEIDRNIGLIERPEYKRRWNTEPWALQRERALREWLLDRLESYLDLDDRMNHVGRLTEKLAVALFSVAKLADVAGSDCGFHEVGAAYRDDAGFDVQMLVQELVSAESVPLLPVLRYKASGLRKRAEWEQTWQLQRREDGGEEISNILVPPDYKSADFISTGGARYWALRGKLDVPKERWISFPYCEGPDGTLVICWAGYDHLQQARAISAWYVRVQTEFGGSDDPRLIPLLACLIELLPWLKQWHNDPDPAFDGMRMGDYFEGFIQEEARNLPRGDGGTGWTLEEIKAWEPPRTIRGRRRTSRQST